MIIDRSVEFQEAVRAKDVNYPPKRPRKQFGANRQQSSSGAAQLDPWTKQAEQVVTSVCVGWSLVTADRLEMLFSRPLTYSRSQPLSTLSAAHTSTFRPITPARRLGER